MKKYILSLVVFAAAIFTSCTSNNGVSPNTGNIVSSGSWRVTLFTDSGIDETTDFSGYSFTFSSGGMLAAVKNGVTQNGTWSVNSSSNKFNIDLGVKGGTNKPLGDLTNDWKIISSTGTEIRLKDDNTSSNEFVTFSKN